MTISTPTATSTSTATPSYIIGISYIGAPDFTVAALASLGDRADRVVIADNRRDDATPPPPTAEGRAMTLRQLVPLSHTQTHNLFWRLARDNGDAFYFAMHNDAEASPDVVDEMAARAADLTLAGTKWAVLFSAYDALACYSVAAMDAVGGWDDRLPNYCSDNDCYWRFELAGFKLIETGLPVKHEGSHMLKLDIERKWINHNVTFDLYHEYFRKKWGGYTHERDKFWKKPWNGEIERLKEDAAQRPKPGGK